MLFGEAPSTVSLIAGKGATLGLAAAVLLARVPRGGVGVDESWTRTDSAGRPSRCRALLAGRRPLNAENCATMDKID